jgi:hypothetical protein
MKDSSVLQSTDENNDDGITINLSNVETIQLEGEDKRKLFVKLMEDWKAESSKVLERSISRMKGAHVKKISLDLKLLMDELRDIISRWTDVGENDDEWNDIFEHLKFSLQKHICHKIGKTL